MTQDEIQGDIVTAEWLTRHRVAIPRAAGVFDSPTAWVRVAPGGTIIAAGEKDQTVLAWLVDHGILEWADLDYGVSYVTCRAAQRSLRKATGYKSCLHLPTLSGGDGLTCEQAADVFSLITRELGRKNCEIIEYACDTTRTPDTPFNYRPPFREAFSALARAFGKAFKETGKEAS